jgi:hypothetical protein
MVRKNKNLFQALESLQMGQIATQASHLKLNLPEGIIFQTQTIPYKV